VEWLLLGSAVLWIGYCWVVRFCGLRTAEYEVRTANCCGSCGPCLCLSCSRNDIKTQVHNNLDIICGFS